MLELRPLSLSIVACLAPREVLEGLAVREAVLFPVAPNEALLLSAAHLGEATLAAAEAVVGETGLVVDQTEAFSAWTLEGEGSVEACCRLSAISVHHEHSVMLQGLVAHVPAKVLVQHGAVHILVDATLGHHVAQGIRDVCSDLNLREGDVRAFDVATGTAIR